MNLIPMAAAYLIHPLYGIGGVLIAFGLSLAWMRTRPVPPVYRCIPSSLAVGWMLVVAGIVCIAIGVVKHARCSAKARPNDPTPHPQPAQPTQKTHLKPRQRRADGMVLIPSGEFMMGSPDTELGEGGDHGDSESPLHKVTIKKPFYMGQYELTQAQWTAVSGNQSEVKGDTLPAESVSWEDCHKFCAAMSSAPPSRAIALKSGVGIRLPRRH